jgi:hypothetical protein
MAKSSQFVISSFRGGRNGSDSPLLLPEDQCCDAVNVELRASGLMTRRGGVNAIGMTFSSGGPFVTQINSMVRHVPADNESAAELWAVDASTPGNVGRLAGATTWVEPTLADDPSAASGRNEMRGVTLDGLLFLAYDSAVNRLHVWDASDNTVRRVGFATPAIPSVGSLGGSGLTFTRYYRIRWVDIDGSDTKRRSEPSPLYGIALVDDAGTQTTRSTAPGEGETHWELEYSDDEVTWYRRAQIAIATTTYDDTDATIDTTLPLSADDGDHTPVPSFKYIARAGGRYIGAGCWETSAGSSFVPRANEVWWTPVSGASDIGDLERIPPDHRVTLDHAVIGISEPLNGINYVFGPRAISALIPTGATSGAAAFQRITERTDIGAIRHEAISLGEDGHGNPAVLFLSATGPWMISASGFTYLGADNEDIWSAMGQNYAHTVYYADKHQWWVFIADDDDVLISRQALVLDTTLLRRDPDDPQSMRGGWVRYTGAWTISFCSALFSRTIAASMSRSQVPYVGAPIVNAILQGDTGTDDGGAEYQAYVDTKEYAPAGLGRNCSIVEPHLIAEVSSTAAISVTARTDFGKDVTTSGDIGLMAEYEETHVQRKVEGLQTSDIGTVRFRIGDADDVTGTDWTLDAFVAQVEDAGPR